MSPKTCVLDQIPVSFPFECSDEIVPQLSAIVNLSLLTGVFPSCMKAAVDKSLLKKVHLTQMCLKQLGSFQIFCVQTY